MTEFAQVPALTPARMINEHVYCPRLFYLEWVDDRWASTAEGHLAHRRVDTPTGALPEPDDAQFLSRATSVRLSSDEMGIVAVVDRVNIGDGRAVPVDIKLKRYHHEDPDVVE